MGEFPAVLLFCIIALLFTHAPFLAHRWFIDYWMEGGLLRDVFTNNRVTPLHWEEIMLRPFHSREELSFDKWSNSIGVATKDYYDFHCDDGDVSGGCEPVEVVSVDRLVDATWGPGETKKIATTLLTDSRTGDYVINHTAWNCIWEELIEKRKGPKTIYDRPGKSESRLTAEFSLDL